MSSITRRLATLLASALLASLTAHAALPPIPANERVLFSEDFADNNQQWSAIAVVNKTGKPASTQAAIIDSQWTASLTDSVAIVSTVSIKPAIRLRSGPVSVYLFAQVADPSGTEGNRFGVTLHEPSPLRGFARLVVRPSANAFLEFREESGAGRSIPIASTRSLFGQGPEAKLLKFTLTPGSDANSPATAEAFYYDTKTKTYVSFGLADSLVWLKGGEIASLSLTFRNGESGPVWIDSVVVTQTSSAP